MKRLCLSVLAGLFALPAVQAQGNLKTSELNVFKNGSYFVVKEGSVKLKDHLTKLELPKSPLLGTFWLTTTRDISIEKIVFMNDTLKVNKPALTIPDLLKINKGKKMKLIYRLEEKTTGELSGTLMEFNPAGGLVKLRTSDNRFAYLNTSDIKQLFIDEIPNESLKSDSTAYMASIKFSRDPEDTRLKMVYMQRGIQWLPSYNIKVLNDKELQLEMRALVENFAEVINDADLTLTVGDPNYKYGQSVEHFINPYLTNLSGGYSQFNTYKYQNVAAGRAMAAEGNAPAADQGYADYQEYTTEGEKTGDLYMYSVGKVSIPKNSKAAFQIFSQKIPYKDIYKVSLSDIVNYGNTRYINIDPERKYDVFHSLKITNSIKNPFTTAPVFVMDETLRPLAQDELKYTPIGDNVSVQLSKSPDIIVKNTEEETDRIEKARVIDKNTYNKVTIKGNILIQNTLGKKVNINIEKTVMANMIEVSDGGSIRRMPDYSGLNPTSFAEWDISLDSGEKKTLTYVYEVYVNARY